MVLWTKNNLTLSLTKTRVELGINFIETQAIENKIKNICITVCSHNILVPYGFH